MAGSPGISIHALLAESDAIEQIAAKIGIQFQSTLSLRRATLDPYTGNFPIR